MRVLGLVLSCLLLRGNGLSQQASGADALDQGMKELRQEMIRTESQIEASQKQMIELKQRLASMQQQLTALKLQPHPVEGTDSSSQLSTLADEVESLKEDHQIDQAELAVHEQSKVESVSRYPIKLSGTILLNSFSNTKQTSIPQTPTYFSHGSGTTGLSLSQTALGLQGTGPHLWGATSAANVWIDFFGNATQNGSNSAGAVRLRTAFAALDWKSTEVFFSYDRGVFAPWSPTSLAALAQPALAWSGNLWAWNPQIGVTYRFPESTSTHLKLQAGLMDVANPPNGSIVSVSESESSRWPGGEARVAVASDTNRPIEFGVGGYFSPHKASNGARYNAWAATVDLEAALTTHLVVSGSAYRGQALGGLGAGAYKDALSNDSRSFPIADVGGWAELKERLSERIQLNEAYGIDNAFAAEIRPFASVLTQTPYQALARNRTFTSNVIYSPSSCLSFSFEYRHVQSSPVNSPTVAGEVFGVVAAYTF